MDPNLLRNTQNPALSDQNEIQPGASFTTHSFGLFSPRYPPFTDLAAPPHLTAGFAAGASRLIICI